MLKWYKGSQVKDQVTTGPFLWQLCWGLVSLWHSWRLAEIARVCEQFAFTGTCFPCSELFQSDHSIINGLRCSKTLQNVWLLQISRVATNAWPRPSFESSLLCVANLTHCDHQGLCIFLCYIEGDPFLNRDLNPSQSQWGGERVDPLSPRWRIFGSISQMKL